MQMHIRLCVFSGKLWQLSCACCGGCAGGRFIHNGAVRHDTRPAAAALRPSSGTCVGASMCRVKAASRTCRPTTACTCLLSSPPLHSMVVHNFHPQGAYASLGFARTPTDWRNLAIIIGGIGSLLGGNWLVKKVQASNVNRKRAAALRELEKSN